MESRFVVAAAGVGNERLLYNSVGPYVGIGIARTSFMLVLKGRELPIISAIFPENDLYGLFLGSRKADDGDNVWLVSNYLSFGDVCEEQSDAAGFWLQGTLRTLQQIAPNIGDLNLRWGLYSAPKSELRTDPERLPGGAAIENYRLDNLIAVWPTKLSLAPLLAKDVANRIQERLSEGSPDTVTEHPGNPTLGITKERWAYTELLTLTDLMSRYKLRVD